LDEVFCDDSVDGGDSQLEPIVTEVPDPEISLHAIVGALNPKTMRLFGMLRTHKVAVLLDTGSNIFGLRNVAEGSLAS